MAYSYTERKRIRKSFGSRDSVLEVPYLLQMQKDAYTAFLQAGVSPKKRSIEGLQAAFNAAFPIVSHNGFVEMKFLEYNLANFFPVFRVKIWTYAEAVAAATVIGLLAGIVPALTVARLNVVENLRRVA